MAKKQSSLVARIFVLVIALLIGLSVFVPVFSVNATYKVGEETKTSFSAAVSAKDVLSVAFLSEEAKAEELANLKFKRSEDIAELVIQGKSEMEAESAVNSYAYAGRFALLQYIASEKDVSFLGVSTATWLIISAVLEIVVLVALALCIFFSYMCMQYDNVKLPTYQKGFAIGSAVLAILLMLVFGLALNGKLVGLTISTTIMFLGYVVMALAVYLPIHSFLVFGKRTSYKKSKK